VNIQPIHALNLWWAKNWLPEKRGSDAQ